MMITLHDLDGPNNNGRWRKRLENAKPILVETSAIGAILPRKEYTTLIVMGKYVHVSEDAEVIERAIQHGSGRSGT